MVANVDLPVRLVRCRCKYCGKTRVFRTRNRTKVNNKHCSGCGEKVTWDILEVLKTTSKGFVVAKVIKQ